jgi:hypothetical protein
VKSITAAPKHRRKLSKITGRYPSLPVIHCIARPRKTWPEPDGIRRSTERKSAIPLHPPGGCEPISLRKSDAFSL